MEYIRQAESAAFAPFAFSVPQEVIDRFLLLGGNTEQHRMAVVLEYMKQKSAEQIAGELREIYRGGNGLIVAGRKYAVWYAEEGLRMAAGTSARYTGTAQTFTWEDAAQRIAELLEEGRFATPLELAEAPAYERRQAAERLWNLRHDFSEEAASQGFLPSLGALQGGGFPAETARLADKLADASFCEDLDDELTAFLHAYQTDRGLLRFHFHRADDLLTRVEELLLPRRGYISGLSELPEAAGFITEDEINEALAAGSLVSGSQRRIAAYWRQAHTAKEKADFLKKEYGIGGRSHALSGAAHSEEAHDGKGIRLRKPPCPEVRLSWKQAAERIDELIRQGRYAAHEQAEEQPEQAEVPHAFHEEAEDEPFDTASIRQRLAESGIVNGEVVDPEKLAVSSLIQAVEEVARESERQEEAESSMLAPVYQPGDTVYLEGTPYVVENIGLFDVQLRDPAQVYPIFRSESRERLEQMLWSDVRNNRFLPGAKIEVPVPNSRVTVTAEEAPMLETQMDEEGISAARSVHENGDVTFSFAESDRDAVNRLVAGLPEKGAADTVSNQPDPKLEPAPTSTQNAPKLEYEPEITATVEAVYPGDKNGLPFDVLIEKLHFGEPEQEHQPTHPAAHNFRITDDHLGEGGHKEKFRANMNAINLLHELELDGRQAAPEEQETLSRYVGWGGLADAFDENKPTWADEFLELYTALSPEEYKMARDSVLNAHYTSPTVIRAIYDAVAGMGFTSGNILEPSCGVGNFFGCLPEEMCQSRLYGVELDSISGRIAKQLYPKAHITVAGFETTDRRDFFDLAVGNVPFGNDKINDRAYNKLGFSIHNYFFAKTLDQVRPGGMVAFVTSRYTMDARNPDARKYIAQRAELLGAIRLPNNAFRANAGTDVVSDILFFQKRERPVTVEPDWVHLGQNADGFAINSYFIDHPEMMLGVPTSESTQYGRRDFTLAPIEGANLSEQLHEAIRHIHGTYAEAALPELAEGEEIRESIPADPSVKNYAYAIVDGQVYFRENSVMVRPALNQTAQERIKGLVGLRDCVQKLMDAQLEEASDAAVQALQARLNEQYDAFTAQYGLINSRGNALAFSDDSSYYLLCSLEVLDEQGQLKRKADMFTKRTIKPHRAITSVDTPTEALALSIGERGKVDMAYMSRLCGLSEEEIYGRLKGVIFLNPMFGYGGDKEEKYLPADEYLSGHVREKLAWARRSAQLHPDDYAVNVAALEAAQPKELDASEIDVRLGATWIDKDYIQQFMMETFSTPYHLRQAIQVSYSSYTAEWHISGKSAVSGSNVAAYSTYGTAYANAYRILEDTLNLRDVRIYDTVQDADGKEKRVLNQKATTLAQQKQQTIKDAFREWVWKDADRRHHLVQTYNERFNSTRPRAYDGSHIVFAGMNPEITLREHQRNAVARILYGGNTLLAHEVGAGKSATRS